VLRQPDPLQPDDQDELEPAACHRCEQRGEVPGGERADAEQLQVEHRLLDANFDHAEQREEPEAAEEAGEHEDRARVREDERAADALPHAHQDQPERASASRAST